MSSASCTNLVTLHVRARETPYGKNNSINRFFVPDEKVSWSIPWTDYQPTLYEAEKLATSSWADPNILLHKEVKLKFHALDGKVDRTSFHGNYELDKDGLPLNPLGRTGLRGRGNLGRWGPNHAADPIVTRWKRSEKDASKIVDETTRKPILQFASIQRRDTKEWAIPGGMVDPGEEITETLKREFGEEALDSTMMTENEKAYMIDMQTKLFQNGIKIYAGYVDDPRNTDNAWMETVAMNFHDETGEGLGKVPLKAGDDAAAVRWADVSGDMKLYASHKKMVQLAAERLGAHW